MHSILKRSLVAILTSVAVAAVSLAVASPAQAYVDHQLRWEIGRINTGNCNAVYDVYWSYGSGDGYCHLGGTHFTKDSGGIAFKTEVWLNGKRRAKIEFHPYGEVLKVCDTENDSDAIHVRLQYKTGGQWLSMPLVSPPGTSKDIECTRKNFSFAEGREIKLVAYDDTSMNDWMASFTTIRA